MAITLRMRSRKLLAAVAGAVMASSVTVSCTSASERAMPEPAVPGGTLTGNYLAARHARTVAQENDATVFLLAAMKESPDDPVLLNRAFTTLVLDGRVDDAAPLAARLASSHPDAVLARIVVATQQLKTGDADGAVASLSNLPDSPYNLFIVPMLSAWAEMARNQPDAAMVALEPLNREQATSALYEVHAAWISDLAGNQEAAVSHVQAAIKSTPEPWMRFAKVAGGILERAGRPDEAEALYRSYLQRHPDSRVFDDALARLGAAKSSAGGSAPPAQDIDTAKKGAAEAFFDAAGIIGRQNNRETALMMGQLGLYLRPDFPELQLLVGDLMESMDRYADANEVYAKIDHSDPLALSAEVATARNLDRLDQADEAEALLRKAAAESPNDPEPMSELGDVLRRHEHFAEAVTAYDDAIARVGTLEPQHWRLLYARGIALERSKQWDRAEADFLKALEFEPDQPFVLNYLGYSWVEQGQHLDRAEKMIRRAVELRPSDGYIVDSLGWVLYRMGRYDEAVTYLERAVELKPEDPVINDHLGDAYWEVGRQREARYQWRAALGKDPEPALKSVLEQKLERGPVREANALVQ